MSEKDLSREEREKNAKWYVVHTYSGHENKVKANLEKMVENRGMRDDIFEVVVPTEEYIDAKSDKKTIKERKKFPGYVLVKMIINDESWYLVRNTRGVTGFVGPSSKPIPLTDEEVKALGVAKRAKVIESDLKVGEAVKIKSGPFENFAGNIDSINLEKQKAKVFVSMFGRETLVELELDQIEKI